MTERQKEFIILAALGYKNNQIAKILFVSQSTVKNTFEKIFEKLNAIDRTNAVAIVLLNGIITTEYYNQMQVIAQQRIQKFC